MRQIIPYSRNIALRSVDEGRDNEAIIVPNPSYDNHFTIGLRSYDSDINTEAVVLSLDGKRIKHVEITDENTSFTLEDKGVFILQVMEEGEISAIRKIVNL